MTPRVAVPEATLAEIGASGRRRIKTIGRRTLSNNARSSAGGLAQAFNGCEVLRHDPESLSAAAFSLAQETDGAVVGCVTREMETSEAFDRDDLTIAKQAPHASQNRGAVLGG
jgi:hypothetical protein